MLSPTATGGNNCPNVVSRTEDKLFSLRGAADPTSDASSVEASGFELKFSKAPHSRKISEKLFEASWLDINAAQ